MPAMSTVWPLRCTTKTDFAAPSARFRAAATVSGVARPDVGSTSQNTTSAPAYLTAFAVAAKVMAGTTTTSRGARSQVMAARWSAAVPLEQTTALGASATLASATSNASTVG